MEVDEARTNLRKFHPSWTKDESQEISAEPLPRHERMKFAKG